MIAESFIQCQTDQERQAFLPQMTRSLTTEEETYFLVLFVDGSIAFYSAETKILLAATSPDALLARLLSINYIPAAEVVASSPFFAQVH